ncbi:MAG TPA: hypothetical protein VJ826_04505 [Candidatus Polarisedimenticolaceae bacterium]|nr:hypothetical protein [Candidatus Polarisedimenticolaceae bacterium]
MSEALFENVLIRDSRRDTIIKRAFLVFVGIHVVLMLWSGWRAWFQVKSLEMGVPFAALRPGVAVSTDCVNYCRVPVEVKVELVQGERVERLATQQIRDHWIPAYDPRWRRGTQRIVVTPEMLAGFSPGPATLRATATGRPQWLRLPPPLVREAAVVIPR